jgi:hypothetical protein
MPFTRLLKLLLQKVISGEVLEAPGLLLLTRKMSSRSLIYGYGLQHLPRRQLNLPVLGL